MLFYSFFNNISPTKVRNKSQIKESFGFTRLLSLMDTAKLE